MLLITITPSPRLKFKIVHAPRLPSVWSNRISAKAYATLLLKMSYRSALADLGLHDGVITQAVQRPHA
jgi:hypothetical protein